MAATTGRAPRQRYAIEIDAGQAFGTGHHASTRGCLLALDDLLKRRRPAFIVDIGTGTGMLAIAAANALQAQGGGERQRSDRGRRSPAKMRARTALMVAGSGAPRGGFTHPGCGGPRPISFSPICSNARSTSLRPEWRRMSRKAASACSRASLKPRRERRGAHPRPRLRPEKANRSRWMDDSRADPRSARRCAIDRAKLCAYKARHVSDIRRCQFPGRERRPGQGASAGVEVAQAQGLSRSPQRRASERVPPPPAERLAWLTGFTGSAGMAMVLEKAAALFVDGRYILQARAQADRHVRGAADARGQASSWIAAKLGQRRVGRLRPLAAHDQGDRTPDRDARQVGHQAPAGRDQSDRRHLAGSAEARRDADRSARHRICRTQRAGKDPRRAGDARGGEDRRGPPDPARFHRLAVQHPRRRHQAHAGRARLRHRAGERDGRRCSSIWPRSATT